MRTIGVALFLVVLLSPLQAQRVSVVAEPFAFPWCVAWLPDGTPLVTERDGRLLLLRGAKTFSVAGLNAVAVGGQGGLLDVLVLPLENGRQDLILSYAAQDVDGRSLRVGRWTMQGSDQDGWSLSNPRKLLEVLPKSSSNIHFGGRLALLPDRTLLITAGERGDGARAQKPGDGGGKVHRVRLDGTVPSDNPFVGNAAYLPTIWSLGHRNPQGLWVDQANGDVWMTEHGPQGGDEVNLVKPGRNYGWPIITYGVNYVSGTKIGEGTAKVGMEQPWLFWKPSIAPSGLVKLESDRYGAWKGSFFSGALAGQGVSRFRLAPLGAASRTPPDRATVPPAGPGVVVEEQFLFDGQFGRIRDVRVGPDGLLYLTTDDSRGKLLRLDPTTRP